MSIDLASLSATSSQIWSDPSQRMAQKMANLFDQIDTSGSGSITQSQFDQAFQTLNTPKGIQAAGADQVWSQLDPNNTGSVSKQDFINGMTTMMHQMRGGHHHRSSDSGSASTSAQSNDQTASTSASSLQSLITGSQVDITA